MSPMNPDQLRRPLLNIRAGGQQVKVDILPSGQVRLTVRGGTNGCISVKWDNGVWTQQKRRKC